MKIAMLIDMLLADSGKDLNALPDDFKITKELILLAEKCPSDKLETIAIGGDYELIDKLELKKVEDFLSDTFNRCK